VYVSENYRLLFVFAYSGPQGTDQREFTLAHSIISLRVIFPR